MELISGENPLLANPAATQAPAAPSGLETGDLALDSVRFHAMSRLLESLLHDVRNPLNALAINAEVLMEKLRDPTTGAVAPGPEKNLRAIRDQVQRVDTVLRQFAAFLLPARGAGEANLTELLEKALEVLGHETRRARVRVAPAVAPGLGVRVDDLAALSFVLCRVVQRAIERSSAGGEVRVTLEKRGAQAVLMVRAGAEGSGPQLWDADAILEQLAGRVGAQLSVSAGEVSLRFSLSSPQGEGQL